MSDDERYEQLKREIGWHMTGWDVASVVVFVAVVWLLVALA